MKDPERILTEHAMGEVWIDVGIPGLRYCVFTRDGFNRLAENIRRLAYESDGQQMTDDQQIMRFFIDDLRSKFKQIRYVFYQLKRGEAAANQWINAFCAPEHLLRFESKTEISAALQWSYVRGVLAAVGSGEMPGPTHWKYQHPSEATREIAEFARMTNS